MLHISIFLKKDKKEFIFYPNAVDDSDLRILIRNECWKILLKYCMDYKYIWYSRYLICKLSQ